MIKRDTGNVETLESGDIYFIYRPRIGEEDPSGVEDIQRLYIVLSPHGKKRYRLIPIGRKKLPDPGRSGKGKFWGFIDAVSKNPKDIERNFDPTRYETKTRGERKLPAGRPVGEGVYRLIRHDDHTHLAYALELPRRTGEAQEELNIEDEGSYIITVKNPEIGRPSVPQLSEERQASYRRELQERFRGRRFAPVDPPDYLDYEGAEILLVSADEDVKEELGVELDPEQESERSAEIFNDLRMERSEHPVKPLLKGEWD